MAARRNTPSYKLGTGIEVPMDLHKENRKRLCERMRNTKKVHDNCLILLQGGTDILKGDSDTEFVFRQESFFHWTFGVLEPEFFGAIDVKSAYSILFAPKFDETHATFMGSLEMLDEIKVKYDVDEVRYVEDLSSVAEKRRVGEIHTLYGLNTDSGLYTKEAKFNGIEKFKVVNNVLHNEISECRVIKTDLELAVLRYVNKQSSFAHRELMRSVKPDMFEYQVESLFMYNCYFHGAMRNLAYTSIGATGCNCSILHYGHAGAPNDRKILAGDMCLFDMGGEYYCYASDITCSYPVTGKFTADQRIIYEAVLAASRAVLEVLRPGVHWRDMHLLAERKILEHLVAGGLLRGSVDEMLAARLGAVFMPHGLGHFMGVDTHDVGGYIGDSEPRSTLPGLKSLRFSRPLRANMVITVEPGCYFIDFLLDKTLASAELSRFLVPEAISRFRGFGGVRIEDDLIITESGMELMTEVPRTCEEIENFMAGKKYK